MLSDLPDELLAGLGEFPSVNSSISGSVGYSQTIVAQISQLCVDAFAEFCAVYLRAGGPQAAAFAARDARLYELLANEPYDDLFEERTAEAGIATIVTQPLTINERTIGVVVLGISHRDVVSEVGRRGIEIFSSILSTAVEQAQQLEHHYRVSKRLQRAMLPAALAIVDGVTFDAAYRPANDEADVGGDWYDAFEIGDGRIGISVGDVTGHGLEAAVAMSEIRRAIRAAAPSYDSPSQLLNYVDNVLVSQGIGMATTIVGFYNLNESTLRYACAGHPHPVLLSPGGRALYLPGGGLLLGLGMNPASQDWTISISPGATCFLYTDGLLEYGRDVLAGERDLLRAMERIAKRGTPTADALHTEIFNGSIQNTDDCATLALQHADALNDTLSLRYSAFPLSAALAREALRHFFEGHGFTEDRRFEMLAATGEAIANAIEHGDHETGNTFDVDIEIGERVTIGIENKGHWRPFTPREERGRGVPIMRACAENLEISSTSEHTRVVLSFRR